MARQGRTLELLVKNLEAFLAPDGIKVTSPEEFRDEKGSKIGEIDVTLRGKFGSSEIFIGIECRDRGTKKSKPQGVDWIREIRGKKEQLKVDKMIAVSSTGFTSEAIRAANDFKIDLIVVEDVERVNIEGWFKTIIFNWTEELWDIIGIDIHTFPLITEDLLLNRNEQILRLNGSEQLISLHDFLYPKTILLSLLLQLNPQATMAETLLKITDPLTIITNGQEIEVTNITSHVRVWRETTEAKVLLNIHKKADSGEVIGMSGICKIETSNRNFKMMVALKDEPLGTRGMKIFWLTENDEPYELPTGLQISLYGSKD